MDIIIAVLSWFVTIAAPLLALSVPASVIIEKVKKDWKGSQAEKVYKIAQLILFGLAVLFLMMTIVLMSL